MKKTLFVMLCLAWSGMATAQRVEEFRNSLASPVAVDSVRVEHNTVRVSECGDAATLVNQASQSRRTAVGGYRIVIFMSNSQTARADALAARESFDQLYPDERSYVAYENPYFKVAVGNCTSQEEAMVLIERIRRDFPKAFMMRETIPAAELVKP